MTYDWATELSSDADNSHQTIILNGHYIYTAAAAAKKILKKKKWLLFLKS